MKNLFGSLFVKLIIISARSTRSLISVKSKNNATCFNQSRYIRLFFLGFGFAGGRIRATVMPGFEDFEHVGIVGALGIH